MVECIELYKSGLNPIEIGFLLNKEHKAIRRYLVKNDIKLRTKSESQLLKKQREQKSLVVDSYLRNYLDGLLLSDASLQKRGLGALLKQSSISTDWVEEIKDQFEDRGFRVNLGIDKRKQYKTSCNTLWSSNYISFLQEYSRWYLNKVKIVPRDLCLSSVTCRNWLLGDGHCYGSGLRLCCESFTKEDNEFLIEKLKEQNITSQLSKENRITMNKENAEKFLIYSKQELPPVESLKYKWTIGRGRELRRI